MVTHNSELASKYKPHRPTSHGEIVVDTNIYDPGEIKQRKSEEKSKEQRWVS